LSGSPRARSPPRPARPTPRCRTRTGSRLEQGKTPGPRASAGAVPSEVAATRRPPRGVIYRRHARASQPAHSPDLWLRVRYSHRFGGGLVRQRRRGLVPHDPRTPVNPRERPGRVGRSHRRLIVVRRRRAVPSPCGARQRPDGRKACRLEGGRPAPAAHRLVWLALPSLPNVRSPHPRARPVRRALFPGRNHVKEALLGSGLSFCWCLRSVLSTC